MKIVGFHDRNNQHQLKLDVNDDALSGKVLPAESVAANLEDSEIMIERHYNTGSMNEAGRPIYATDTYAFKITKILKQNSWVECTAADCGGLPKQVPLYQFNVTNLSDGCEVPLCKPGLDDHYNGGMSGTAVIFRGDLYNESTYEVTKTASSGPLVNGDPGVFNIACLGTTISKLHFLGHTSASTGDLTTSLYQPTSLYQRQAMLRLFTADYCGVGHSFTEEGTPIKLGFNNPAFKPSAGSGYDLANASTVEALWSQDGATCIGQPRTTGQTVNDIQGLCAQLYQQDPLKYGERSPPPACSPAQPTMATLLNTPGAWALSGNPSP